MSAESPAVIGRRIPIALIDPPEIAMRETMSEDGLNSLTASILELGLLQPIGVVEAGARYRIVYGHRRRVAAERAGLLELECRVWPEGTPLEEAMKVAENDEQEAVNPASEATYYKWLYTNRCGEDVDRVAALVRKPVTRVLDRLDLLRGDPRVLEALRAGAIRLGMAQQLNRCPDDGYRGLFLADAIRSGATIRTVQAWIDDVKRVQRLQEVGRTADVPHEHPIALPAFTSMDACVMCGLESDQHEMEYRKIHASCYRYYTRQRLAGGSGEAPS